MINIEDMRDAGAVIDPVDDAIGAASSAATTGQRPEQRLWSTYALSRPGTRTARVTALVSGAGTGSYVGRVGLEPTTGGL